MRLLNVRRRFCMWQADRSFDPIEEEANHLFVTCVISVAFFELGFGDGLLSIYMPGHLRLGGEWMP